MSWIIALFFLFLIDWFYYPVSWEYLLGSKILAVALALQAAYSLSNSFRYKTILLLLAIIEWVVFFQYLIYLRMEHNSILFAFAYLIYIPCFLYVWQKGYNIKSDDYDKEFISFLFLRPTKKSGLFNIFRLFFGMPILSMCVVAENKVWCFRRNSGNFEFTEYSDKWLDTHILIKTDAKPAKKIIDELSYLVGERRFPYIKCVYILRNVLCEMGGRYKIRSVFEYIPGIYAMRIYKNKGLDANIIN